MESERIELCNCEDADHGEDNKKEKDDKFQVDIYVPKFEDVVSTANILHLENHLSIHHPEIATPPPEPSLS